MIETVTVSVIRMVLLTVFIGFSVTMQVCSSSSLQISSDAFGFSGLVSSGAFSSETTSVEVFSSIIPETTGASSNLTSTDVVQLSTFSVDTFVLLVPQQGSLQHFE